MKPVDTHLSELERRIAQLRDIERNARQRDLTARQPGSSDSFTYWEGYADCAQDLRWALQNSAQWRRDHPL